ncbi:MAG: S-adenosylmethionine-dependent methyltransferase [Cyclobacteriaceae bacterium]|nr:MAG: S-adenosylmethionine-dependent methyltransferase [Cyclobacteriaceae bacterium]
MTDQTALVYLIPCTIAPDSQHQVITAQVRKVISEVNYYLVENIRSARRFISSLNIRDVSTIEFEVFNKHTANSEISALMSPIERGLSIGVISEAGCPAIADPGNRIVLWAHHHQIRVVPLSGPSSIILALMASGLNGQHFEFHGYLPIDKTLRLKKIKLLENESLKTGQTQIFMETPYRNQSLAVQLVEQCNLETLICFASDITDTSEAIITTTVEKWRNHLPDLHKKPTIFLMQARSSHF